MRSTFLPIVLVMIMVWANNNFMRGAQSSEQQKSCFFSTKYEVFIFSSLPPNTPLLNMKCWSKDDDLGIHRLAPGQNFNFRFCENFVFRTLFACHLKWNGKDRGIEVFNSHWTDALCDETGQCYWFVKEDGIYFSDRNPPKYLQRRYEW